MRRPDDIIHNGKTLTESLRLHKMWLDGVECGERADLRRANLRDANLRGANLRYADLRYTNLRGADLQDADLRYAVGNMKQIKSMQFDKWSVVYTHDTLCIGCQQHSIEMWRKADPRWITAMDENATDWWAKFGAAILNMIDISPATGN